jgi:polyferredoxin/Flp pilus assembly protein TadD
MKNGCDSQKPKKQRSIELPVLQNPAPQEKDKIRDSRASRWRAGALLALNLLMIAHIIQWRFSGQTISPIEPSEAMHTLERGAVNAGFIFFALAILATLIFGRFVCGWGCHILALQDFCAWLLKKIGLKPKPFRSRLLIFVPLIVALYMFVYPTVYRYFVKPASQPLFPQWTNHLVTSDFWATFPPVLVAIPFLFICGFMIVYFLGQKGFCTYACPYGGFFGLADKVAPGRIRVDQDLCESCGHCTAVCTSNVLVHKEVKEYGMVVDPGCMKCMDCVSVCPNDALSFGFGKPAIGVSKKIKKNYSLTWTEEIAAALVFAASFFAAWDVYQLVPMLMALGIACVTTFLVVRLWQLVTKNNSTFFGSNLKSSGTIQKAGWTFITFALIWVGLNAHSGWIRFNEYAGRRAFEYIKIPDELALARPNPARWLSQDDRENIVSGKKHFYRAFNAGLFVNKEALSKLAWIEYLSGNNDQAVQLLQAAAERQEGQGKALSLYYRGAILNRLGRFDQALAALDAALAERPDLVTAREEKGEALWQLGRREEAVAVWRDAVGGKAGLPLANNFLAGAARLSGQAEAAAAYERQADQLTPDDPLFHWTLGLRLEKVGMGELAEKHFARAIQLNPEFRKARSLDLINR